MSFIVHESGKTYTPGYFLSSADCERKTVQVAATGDSVTTTEDGKKYVAAGTIYPANGATAAGIIYEDVDVTAGAAAGSLVTRGRIFTNRLPVAIDSAAQTALEGKGFVFETEPTVTRP
jgi:hypothetical protein